MGLTAATKHLAVSFLVVFNWAYACFPAGPSCTLPALPAKLMASEFDKEASLIPPSDRNGCSLPCRLRLQPLRAHVRNQAGKHVAGRRDLSGPLTPCQASVGNHHR